MKTCTIQEEGKKKGMKVVPFDPIILGKKGSAPAEYEVKIGHCVAVKAWSAWRMPFGGIICPFFWC